MRAFAFVLVLSLAGTLAGPPSPEPPTRAPEEVGVEDLAWLAGTWRSGAGPNAHEETWGAPLGDSLAGMYRAVGGGKVSLYELMSVEEDPDHGLVFRLRHFHRGLVPWAGEADGPLTYPLHDLGEQRVVFEDPAANDPRRFVYEREGDRLTIRLEREGGEPMVFSLARVE